MLARKMTFSRMVLMNNAAVLMPCQLKMQNLRVLRAQTSLPLHFTDDRFMSFKAFKNYTLFESGKILRVVLDLTDKEQELYDGSYLKDIPEVYKAGFAAKESRQEAISISSCLDAFLIGEPLGPDDMWYCPRCKENRQAIKKLDLWMLLDIIVFHLKRFTYGRYPKNKIDTF